MNAMRDTSPLVHQSMLSLVNTSIDRNPSNPWKGLDATRFNSQDLERLGRFQQRTVLSIGSKRTSEIYQDAMFQLACNHQYLMHMIQALTAVHDRYLSPAIGAKQTAVETYHLGRALVLFNEKLSGAIEPGEGDAIWSTAALIGLVSFALIDASTPEEAWPLAPPSRTDLEWLAMSDGKKTIWSIANPTQKNSLFHKLSADFEHDYFAAFQPQPGDGILLSEFTKLCRLDNSSDNNPYYDAVHSLLPLLDLDCNGSTMMRFLSFISYMNPKFKTLLKLKDPVAMLLLAYWFSKLCNSQWWVSRRAVLECQAICIYLEKYHGDIPNIHELLRFPRMRCGLSE